MFKYNSLSDLKNGKLVTPLRLENGKIICINEDGNEEEYIQNDFDFAKTIQQRNLNENISYNDVIEQMEADSPRPEIIEVEKEVIKEVIKEVRVVESNSNFRELTDAVKRNILKKAGLNYTGNMSNVAIDIETLEV